MTIQQLLDALRSEVCRRMANGEFTERSLAGRVGVSQPQIHNVLKGARKLTPELADRVLEALGISMLDLF